ncbi:MAG TPA: hypothetical protein VJY35_01730 [Candidatus Eisenbacteria bacterium]|nr:hypothetical protein [Candidatus Eisenbacteria bacterium]
MMARRFPALLAAALMALSLPSATLGATADVPVPVPPGQRGRLDAERSGFHDANNIRTVFWNFGMVGDYPSNPGDVDLSAFHSVEVPKGSGMNYSDGITPFVLNKIRTQDGQDVFLMETGFRERQEISPQFNRIMRFEPRPGYFEPNPTLNPARSPAISSDPRTWPSSWPDRLDDPGDPGWAGAWNGYFGKRPAADQESYTVMDDDFYDRWLYTPDSRDPTRRGLGLRVEVRGFQWANPQAGNVIFWHYDIANESTIDYNDIIFGLYMDSGVGGSALSCDGIFESDDDNAFFDKSSRLNLVYTWDRFGHGRDLSGNCSRTGYLGYAYLETPGNPFDGLDNDEDGFVDERRDGGPGTLIVGQDEIRAYVVAHYDLAQFQSAYGPLENRPPYRIGRWWTGDEDMDWVPELHDVGGDGVPETGDAGEGDGMPTDGEPNFDRTDLNESDQIGLTGFKMNRIKAGANNPNSETDGILFYTDANSWPERLYNKFSDPYEPARFDSALASNYNIGFLFASGPFILKAGQRERFSLALAFGADLAELRTTVGTVQQIYNANYQFAVPPPMPTLTAEAGDRFVRLSWDDVAERGVDPVSSEFDFEGYKIYRSTEPDFRDPELITTGRGGDIGLRKPILQMDIVDGRRGFSNRAVEGVQYWLGDETGITHTWTDTTVTNGQEYYYAVVAFDYGVESPYDSLRIYPSQNAVAVSRTTRGGIVLPKNIVNIRPNPRAQGFVGASADTATHVLGKGVGQVSVGVVNSNLIPENHLFKVAFLASSPESVRATRYVLADSTAGLAAGTAAVPCFSNGRDFHATGAGAVGCGLLPLVTTIPDVRVDTTRTGFAPGGQTNVRLLPSYSPVQPADRRRPGYPDDISIVFEDAIVDTGLSPNLQTPARPARFRVFAHTATGDIQLDFVFRDSSSAGAPGNLDGTLSGPGERIDILCPIPNATVGAQITWIVRYNGTTSAPIVAPRSGDVYHLRLETPIAEGDVFTFTTRGQRIAASAGQAGFETLPYVVPNPYIEAASFEPARFNLTGRGERRIEFRGLPSSCTVRIYTVRGDLVQTLRHEASFEGFVAWDLRTRDNLEVAPGLYIFHVDAPGIGTHVGKFAIIK